MIVVAQPTADLAAPPSLERMIRVVFAEWFGVGLSCAGVLVALYRANGEPQPSVELALASGTATATVSTHAIKLLRQALDSEAIDHVPGRGYALTDVGLAECRRALERAGEELRGA